MVQFVSPPGWPTPPPGWLPPAGWLPDRSWPSPPPGWVFYLDEFGRPAPPPPGGWQPTPYGPPTTPPRRGLLIGVLVTVAAVVVAGALLLGILLTSQAPDVPPSINPTPAGRTPTPSDPTSSTLGAPATGPLAEQFSGLGFRCQVEHEQPFMSSCYWRPRAGVGLSLSWIADETGQVLGLTIGGRFPEEQLSQYQDFVDKAAAVILGESPTKVRQLVATLQEGGEETVQTDAGAVVVRRYNDTSASMFFYTTVTRPGYSLPSFTGREFAVEIEGARAAVKALGFTCESFGDYDDCTNGPGHVTIERYSGGLDGLVVWSDHGRTQAERVLREMIIAIVPEADREAILAVYDRAIAEPPTAHVAGGYLLNVNWTSVRISQVAGW